ncbi:hypothetical protein AB0903_00970 [Streptomyces sp. NPDC048389]|uniref:hypothetical protein n=1 Tax=Streptomyces sp. NPDC048389 TaxID=3154622 RepID=UPI003455E8F4
MKRQRGRGRVTLAGVAAACVVGVLPGQSWAAGEPSPYVFDSEAKPVKGTPVNINGPELTAGSTYRDSIGPGEKLYYRIDLDGRSNAFVSAVAVPEPGTKVGYLDKLEVSIEDKSGTSCGDGDVRFGSAGYPRPVADYASRRIEKDSTRCQQADAYYVVLERSGDEKSTPETWGVELRFVAEPGLKAAGPTKAPENWPSASPAAPAGGPQKRHGGTGFHDSTGLGQGEWQDTIKPGETLFYRVPLDWGQQIFAGADLANSPVADGAKSVSNALVLALYNPARGFVDDESSMYYDGKQKTVSLDPLPPVAYENRYDSDDSAAAMRFAGWYYLTVTLNPEIAEEYGENPMPLTLRVNIKGEPKEAPAYAGPVGDFEVTEANREAAESGKSAEEAATGDGMMLLAVGAIGLGTLLVLGLGVWTLLARRRTPQDTEPAALSVPGQPGPQGPAQGARGYGQEHGQQYGYGQHGPTQGH